MSAITYCTNYCKNYFSLAQSAFRRHNPLAEIVMQLVHFVNTWMNLKSDKKLNTYRHTMYMQQLKRMESFISQGSPYGYERGLKIDRKF